MQTDPIGYEDNMNLYGYVGNDPINNTDPTGEIAFGLIAKVIKVAIKGGDIASTVAGAVEDFNTVTDSSASIGTRLLAAGSLISEVVSPVSARDVKAGVGAVKSLSNAKSASSSVGLQKQLASESQLGQLSKGQGSVISQPAKQADRIAAQTGGNPANIQKVSSDVFKAKDGQTIQTHAFRDASTNKVIEPKTIINENVDKN